jgi:hypothetical protein
MCVSFSSRAICSALVQCRHAASMRLRARLEILHAPRSVIPQVAHLAVASETLRLPLLRSVRRFLRGELLLELRHLFVEGVHSVTSFGVQI